MFEDIKAACKTNDPIFAYAHSTGAATLVRALKMLSDYNCDKTKWTVETNCKPCYVSKVYIYAGTVSQNNPELGQGWSTFANTTYDTSIVTGTRDVTVDLGQTMGNADKVSGPNIGQPGTLGLTAAGQSSSLTLQGCNQHQAHLTAYSIDQGHGFGVSKEMYDQLTTFNWRHTRDPGPPITRPLTN
jgi:hypothetical protein